MSARARTVRTGRSDCSRSEGFAAASLLGAGPAYGGWLVGKQSRCPTGRRRHVASSLPGLRSAAYRVPEPVLIRGPCTGNAAASATLGAVRSDVIGTPLARQLHEMVDAVWLQDALI